MTEQYGEILEVLKERIVFNHKRYGMSYLNRSLAWLCKRLDGEVAELKWEIRGYFESCCNHDAMMLEALDVAIVAILIADRARRWIK